MEERQETYMGGNLITLLGPKLSAGDSAPDFMVLDNELMPKYLEDYYGKIKVISAVVSLETGVCDQQTRKFNELASEFNKNVAVLTISMDLPFTQKRWCGAAGAERVITLSDHKEASFGTEYGILIKELRLLNRAIFLIDDKDIIQYIEIVQENHNHPDYDRALNALKNTA